MNNILIGTSGFDYPEWKGIFYPEDLKRADFLSYYATQFNALEINNTFYNMPTAERLLSFYERSEGKLNFSIKVNRLLTHEISGNWKIAVDDFKKAIEALKEKDRLSAVLFQLPQSFHYTKENRIYLSNLLSEFEDFPNVVEFRHKEWIKESVFEGLEKRNTGIVYCDMPQLSKLPDAQVVKTPFLSSNAYIRLHGRNAEAWYAEDSSQNGSSRYTYNYSDEELKYFVPIIKTASEGGKRVHVFFNNHPNGDGAKNAVSLMKMFL